MQWHCRSIDYAVREQKASEAIMPDQLRGTTLMRGAVSFNAAEEKAEPRLECSISVDRSIPGSSQPPPTGTVQRHRDAMAQLSETLPHEKSLRRGRQSSRCCAPISRRGITRGYK
jgi:hypothetical protein